MIVFITTEEPYHEGSTIVGVHLRDDEAVKFVESRPRHPLANGHDGVDHWLLTCWNTKTQKVLSTQRFCKQYHPESINNPPTSSSCPIGNADWQWDAIRLGEIV